jgi:hypothetical protein
VLRRSTCGPCPPLRPLRSCRAGHMRGPQSRLRYCRIARALAAPSFDRRGRVQWPVPPLGRPRCACFQGLFRRPRHQAFAVSLGRSFYRGALRGGHPGPTPVTRLRCSSSKIAKSPLRYSFVCRHQWQRLHFAPQASLRSRSRHQHRAPLRSESLRSPSAILWTLPVRSPAEAPPGAGAPSRRLPVVPGANESTPRAVWAVAAGVVLVSLCNGNPRPFSEQTHRAIPLRHTIFSVSAGPQEP